MNPKNSEIFPELILPLDSIALENSIALEDSFALEDSIVSENFLVSEDSLVSEDFLVSEDSLVSKDFFTSENNFTSEYSLALREIDVDPLTGAKNPTVDASEVAAVPASRVRTVTVKSIKCIRADADWYGDDDIYISVGNEFLWGVYGMDDGESRRVGRSEEYRGETTIGVWDRDFSSSNDLIGTIRVNGYYRGPAKVVTGGGSEYLVDFTST